LFESGVESARRGRTPLHFMNPHIQEDAWEVKESKPTRYWPWHKTFRRFEEGLKITKPAEGANRHFQRQTLYFETLFHKGNGTCRKPLFVRFRCLK